MRKTQKKFSSFSCYRQVFKLGRHFLPNLILGIYHIESTHQERLSAEGQIIEKPEDLLKDPYVLEFTGLPELAKYSETDLETKIIDHLQEFLLELGRGFTFVGRQVRFTFEDEHYRVLLHPIRYELLQFHKNAAHLYWEYA